MNERKVDFAVKRTRKLDPLENAMQLLFFLCGAVAVAFVLVITVYLVVSGLPAIQKVGLGNFLLGTTWDSANKTDPQYGILPFILTSIYGFMTAMFLAKAAPPKLAAVVRPAVDLLAGIPSVVYGMVGMVVLLPGIRGLFHLKAGDTLLAAILVLAVMILPSIISVSETALRAVPREYEEASLALGATEMETYFRVSAPAAKSGIAAAVVLGVGRAIGEAMAIMMVAGNAANMPGLFRSVKFLTTAVASEMSYAADGSLQKMALFSIGLVLFLFIMMINVFLNLVLKREKE